MNHLIQASYVVNIIIIILNVISGSHHMMTTIVSSIMCIQNASSVNRGILTINSLAVVCYSYLYRLCSLPLLSFVILLVFV